MSSNRLFNRLIKKRPFFKKAVSKIALSLIGTTLLNPLEMLSGKVRQAVTDRVIKCSPSHLGRRIHVRKVIFVSQSSTNCNAIDIDPYILVCYH